MTVKIYFFSGNDVSLKFPDHPYIHKDKRLFATIKETYHCRGYKICMH